MNVRRNKDLARQIIYDPGVTRVEVSILKIWSSE
nr:MAG TPA: hypothetical protein [Caudoviricetes sp.]